MSKSTTAKPKAAKPAAVTNKIVMLAPARLMDPDFGWRTFEATVPDAVSRDHILSGAFYRLCARRVRKGDRIAWRDNSLDEIWRGCHTERRPGNRPGAA